MINRIPILIVIAFIIDYIIGDPPSWPHPVKLMGKWIHFLDKKLNHDKKRNGLLMLFIVLISVAIVSILLLVIAYKIHWIFGYLIESIMVATTISQKGLKEAALEVYYPLEKNRVEKARKKLSYIVGRDTETLKESEITRATIETIAENTTDGITSPIFWTLVAGGPGALIYRAINTCDSMVAYKNKKYANFGWASAKLDDLVNYIPARITGIIMLYSASNSKDNLVKDLRKEARKHSSPNSGWTEAAAAIALGIELGGYNYYQGVQTKANKIGLTGRRLEKNDILIVIQMMQKTVFIFTLTILLGVLLYVFAKTWS